ncbi:globin [Shouchella clausii]|uniref:globin domain-containing protein n=1 Tax=Shouchella clausii TaxID=79880 RepID=UPI000BA6DA36|nr:globin [Shouchella clausii]PAD18992.1 globin [Shouchella clausii]
MPDQRNEQSPFEALGGEEKISELVDAFYRYIAAHEDVRHLFPEDLTHTAYKQKRFLTQFFGGPPLYTEEFGHPRLRARHMPFVISPVQAEAWLSCMERAMDDVHLSGDIRDYMMHRLRLTAHHMVNHPMPG